MKPWMHRLLALRKMLRSVRHRDTYLEMPRCDLILCCADSDRTDDYAGQAFSRILDSFGQELDRQGLRVQRFAWPYARVVGASAWGFAHCANRRFFRAVALKKTFRALGFAAAAERMDIDFYGRLLDRTGAASIVGIGLPPAAIQAARRRGVKSVEVLHGYGYSSVPWGWDTAPADCLPDAVIAFDALSARTFGELAPKGVQVWRTDNFWYRKFREARYIADLPESWKQDLHWIPRDKKVILVSTSWGYDGDHGPYGFFAGILSNGLFPDELLNAIESAGDRYHWLFRLHPVQLSGELSPRYRRILDDVCQRFPNCEWRNASRAPLPMVLQKCHAHISMISMTAYDAAFMGLKSLMLCPTLKTGGANALMFSDLREQAYVALGSFSAADMLKWLQSAGPAGGGFDQDAPSQAPDLRSLVMPGGMEQQ